MNNCRLTPRAFATITRIETKVWLRDPVAAGMCLVFPVGYILLITAMNEELSADYMVAPVLGIAMAMPTVNMLPASFGLFREKQILRRFHATPMRPQVLLGAHFVITFVAAVLSGVLALTAAQLAFGLTAPESLGLVVLGYGLGLAAMLALGTLIAAVVPRASVGTGIGMITFFVSIILAGAMTPNGLTGALGQIGRLAPLGAATGTMSYGLTGGTFPVVEVIAMVAWTLVLAPTAVKAFRWS